MCVLAVLAFLPQAHSLHPNIQIPTRKTNNARLRPCRDKAFNVACFDQEVDATDA